MLSIQKFTFNSLREHTYIVYNEDKQCAIVDPGCSEAHEQQTLSDFILSRQLQVLHLINTHCHIDHILGNAYVKQTYQVPLAIHPADLMLLQIAATHAPRYGIYNYEPTTADIFLAPGNTIQIGTDTLHVLHVPGHSPGHIALYQPDQKFCLTGDVLFKNAIGRTDLPGGDYEVLLRSIHEQLFTLPNEVILYPGHGAKTTIGTEKIHNPYCR